MDKKIVKEFKKMTAKEILELVEKHLSVENFAYGEFNDSCFFECSKECQEFLEKWEYSSKFRDRRNLIKKYGYASPYDMQEAEYKAAGSPKYLGEWKEVDSGGGMDEGSNWYSVKYFKDHNVYIKTSGYYQSHHGCDFDYGYGEEVFPRTKEIIIYT